MADAQKFYTMIPFGGGGAGKSNFLNKMIGKEGEFKSIKTAASGETKFIKSFKGPAFGEQGQKLINVYDAPGVGDMELSIQQIVADIKESIRYQQVFDAAIIVTKLFDYRASVQEVIALKAIKEFFDNFQPQNVFCVITHCDLDKPDPDTIKRKIESFKKWGGFEIPMENVIQFNNTKESLQPLVDKLKEGNMKFCENLEQKAEMFSIF